MAKSNAAVTILAVAVTLVVAGAGGYMLGARSQKPEAKVVASVNGQTITESSLYKRMVDKYGAQIVSKMIDEALVIQAAKAANVPEASKADIDADIDRIKERIGGEDRLKEALQQYGYTMEELRQERGMQLTITKILSKDLKFTDADLKKFFDENSVRFDQREVQSRHILVNTEAEAKAIREELARGADFAALAKTKSIDPSAQQNGGDLGFNAQGRMVPEFDKVVFAMKKGEISAPFQSQYGWHVAQVMEIKGSAPNFETQKAEVREAYIDDAVGAKIQPWLEEQRTKAKINNSLEKKS